MLRFDPAGEQIMLVARRWSRWVCAEGEELLSIAAIADDPPEEVSAEGHDRRIVPIKADLTDIWLKPGRADLANLYAIVDDRLAPGRQSRYGNRLTGSVLQNKIKHDPFVQVP